MSHVNIIQGLFTLAVLGDGGIGSSTCTEARKLMNLPRIQAHLSVLPVHSAWLFMTNCNKYPYQSVLFLLSSSPLWASQKGNVWHTHCSSSQHHNGSSFWLEDGLMLDPSNTHQGFQETFLKAADLQGWEGRCRCLEVLTHVQVCGTATLDWTGPQPGCRTDEPPLTYSSTWWFTSLPSAISSCRAGEFLAPSA